MRRRRSGRTGLSLACAAALATAGTTPTAPAAASTGPPAGTGSVGPAGFAYAAIGDSYSSGVGTGRYDLAGGPCLRSTRSFPALWADQHAGTSFTFLACSGVDTTQVRTSQVPNIPSTATFVTVTAGGNDAGFSPVLAICTAAPAERDGFCSLAIAIATARVATVVPHRVGELITAVRQRAPGARVVVLGYPRLFERGTCHTSGAPSDARRARLNELADILDAALAKAAATSGATFVDIRARFADHGVCAAPGRAWINGPGNGPETYHPTAEGHRHGYLPALASPASPTTPR